MINLCSKLVKTNHLEQTNSLAPLGGGGSGGDTQQSNGRVASNEAAAGDESRGEAAGGHLRCPSAAPPSAHLLRASSEGVLELVVKLPLKIAAACVADPPRCTLGDPQQRLRQFSNAI